MAISKITGVRIAGIASAVPEKVRTLADDAKVFGETEVTKISRSTGVEARYVAPAWMCTSDLCYAAAERLLLESNIDRDSIDALVLVTQGPDYIVPATSCVLQSRLRLGSHCAAFDVNLGCSGYVYGIWFAAHLVAAGSARRVMLLVGDLSTRCVSPHDRSTALLFGDAGTATVLEASDKEEVMSFVLGTDGTGHKNLIIPAGSFRNPHTEATAVRSKREDGNIRSDEDLYMNGPEIFAFTLREVSPMISSVLAESGWSIEDVDYFVMHQANRFILEHLARRMKIGKEKMPLSLERFGNTSGASIPITMTHCLADTLRREEVRLVLAGFGVGYSWGAAALTCNRVVMSELVLVPDEGDHV
jgi:3-oxoacyl-[acyl-carrier-protein] synthase-3